MNFYFSAKEKSAADAKTVDHRSSTPPNGVTVTYSHCIPSICPICVCFF